MMNGLTIANKRVMQKITIITLGLLVSVFAHAQINFKAKSIKEAFEQGKAQGKPVFVFIYADGCPHCEAYMKTFGQDKTVGEFYNQQFVNAKVEVNSEEGRKFRGEQDIYVMSTPLLTFWSADTTLLSIAPAGDEQNNTAGILQFGERAINPNTQWSSYKKAFKNGEADPNFLVNTAYLARYTCDTLLNIGAMQRYAQQQQATGFENDDFVILQKVIMDDENPLFLHCVNNLAMYQQKYGNEEVNHTLENIVMFSLYSSRAATYSPSKLAFMKSVLGKIGVDGQNIKGRFLLPETGSLFRKGKNAEAIGLINDFFKGVENPHPEEIDFVFNYVQTYTQDSNLLQQLAWLKEKKNK